jgi:hypothetical protein
VSRRRDTVSVLAGVLWVLAAVRVEAQTAEPATESVNAEVVLYKDKHCTEKLLARDPHSPVLSGTLVVWALDNVAKSVNFEEKERNTRFYNDLQAILGAGTSKKALAIPKPKCQDYRYPLKYKRASVTVTAYDESGKSVGSVVVVTGPPEHLYLGLDLPVNNRKTLKYDSTSNSLLPQSSSPELYLSFNLLAGDILAQASDVHWYEDFSGKLLIRAASRPLDSVGVGVGYRLGKLSALGYSLDALSVFVARVWTKQDALTNGRLTVNGATATSWRFGITYDVGTAAKWVHW